MKKINNMTVFEPTDKCSLDEYSQKAAIEVPELIKKAKEEVNQKVIEISENDIKQDNEILELKTNYTNLQEQNTKLESQIKKDRENMINLEVEGQSIHIEDSSDLEGQLEVLGNVEQDTRTGKNLYKNSSPLVPGLTEDENGFLTVNYDNTKGTSTKFINFFGALEDKIKTNTKYSIVLEIKSLTYTGGSYVQTTSTDPATKSQLYHWNQYKCSTLKSGDIKINSYNSTDNFDGCICSIRSYIGIPAGASVNMTFGLSILEGEVTLETYSYEQYGASPSPEHPSEIRAVGDKGSVGIKKQNKNIILIKPNQKVVTRGLTVETDDNARITINGIAENTTYLKLYKEIAGTYLSEAEKWEKEKIAKGNYRLSIQNLKGNYNTGNPNILMRNSPNSNTEISYLLQELNKDKSIKCTIDKSMEVMWYMYIQKDVIFNNFSFELLLGKTEMNEYSNYILGEEQTYTLPIQKPMLEGDYFDKLNNKEEHTWKKIILDGVNNKVTQETTATNGKYRYKYTDKDFKNCSLSEEKAYCTHLQLIEKNKTYDKMVGFTVSNGALLIYTDGDTAVNFNANLQKENYIFYIPVIESAYEKIDLTPKQIEVLDQLDNLETYKTVTNITTDSIAKLKLKYIADTKTYVDNKTSNLEQQISIINQLLSTTKTSSILLDNLQTDIESEVL